MIQAGQLHRLVQNFNETHAKMKGMVTIIVNANKRIQRLESRLLKLEKKLRKRDGGGKPQQN